VVRRVQKLHATKVVDNFLFSIVNLTHMGNDKRVAHFLLAEVSYFYSYYEMVVVGIDASSDNTLGSIGDLFR
jgi:hypothetical protein